MAQSPLFPHKSTCNGGSQRYCVPCDTQGSSQAIACSTTTSWTRWGSCMALHLCLFGHQTTILQVQTGQARTQQAPTSAALSSHTTHRGHLGSISLSPSPNKNQNTLALILHQAGCKSEFPMTKQKQNIVQSSIPKMATLGRETNQT